MKNRRTFGVAIGLCLTTFWMQAGAQTLVITDPAKQAMAAVAQGAGALATQVIQGHSVTTSASPIEDAIQLLSGVQASKPDNRSISERLSDGKHFAEMAAGIASQAMQKTPCAKSRVFLLHDAVNLAYDAVAEAKIIANHNPTDAEAQAGRDAVRLYNTLAEAIQGKFDKAVDVELCGYLTDRKE